MGCGPVLGDLALQILSRLYTIRKPFMQARHVGYGITMTGDLGLAWSLDCLTGSNEHGADTPARVDQKVSSQTSHEDLPNALPGAKRRLACEGLYVGWISKAVGLLLVSSPAPTKASATRHTVV